MAKDECPVPEPPTIAPPAIPDGSGTEEPEFRDEPNFRAYYALRLIEDSALLLIADEALSARLAKVGWRTPTILFARWLDNERGKTRGTSRIMEGDEHPTAFPASHEYSVFAKRVYVENRTKALLQLLLGDRELLKLLNAESVFGSCSAWVFCETRFSSRSVKHQAGMGCTCTTRPAARPSSSPGKLMPSAWPKGESQNPGAVPKAAKQGRFAFSKMIAEATKDGLLMCKIAMQNASIPVRPTATVFGRASFSPIAGSVGRSSRSSWGCRCGPTSRACQTMSWSCMPSWRPRPCRRGIRPREQPRPRGATLDAEGAEAGQASAGHGGPADDAPGVRAATAQPAA